MLTANNEYAAPILWSLSRVSGPLFQVPLFAAFETGERAWTVSCAEAISSSVFTAAGRSIGQPNLSRTLPALARLPAERSQLARAVAQRGTIVHVTMTSPADALLLPTKAQTNVPVVVTIHDHERHLGEKNRLLDFIDERIFAKADHIATLSRVVYDGVRRRRPSVPVHLVENGLATRTTRGLPARPGFLGRTPRLLFVGRIHAYKGVDLLLDALSLLRASGRGIRCTIAGSGDTAPYADKLAALDEVQLINRWLTDQEVEGLLAEHDILVLPYLEATQSGVAVDAQWAAMPAIATPVGALVDQFRHGETALIAPDVSTKSLAETIGKLTSNERLFCDLSKRSHDAYRDKDLPAIASCWKQLYQEIA
jgi:glycosyltransferase involved in cell wall biosynthesis